MDCSPLGSSVHGEGGKGILNRGSRITAGGVMLKRIIRAQLRKQP